DTIYTEQIIDLYNSDIDRQKVIIKKVKTKLH
ncbi:MAG: hypothetical protein RIR08_1181, partial [Pseudomonadota bacterium]